MPEPSGNEIDRIPVQSTQPVFIGQPFHVCGSLAATGLTVDLWILDHRGAVAMIGTAGIDQLTSDPSDARSAIVS